MRGHVLRYLGWQALDRTLPRVGAGLILGAGFISLIWVAARADGTPSSPEMGNLLAQLHQQVAFLSVILLTNGMVAHDRTQGWYRFYLAKPVSPTWFYGQSAILAVVGMGVVTTGFIVLGSLLLAPIWPWRLLHQGLGLALLFGMAIAFFSTLTKYDWLFGVLLMIVSSSLRARFPADESTLGRVANVVLPPNHLLRAGHELSLADWAWLGGWSVALFVAMLLVLRLRPLGED